MVPGLVANRVWRERFQDTTVVSFAVQKQTAGTPRFCETQTKMSSRCWASPVTAQSPSLTEDAGEGETRWEKTFIHPF